MTRDTTRARLIFERHRRGLDGNCTRCNLPWTAQPTDEAYDLAGCPASYQAQLDMIARGVPPRCFLPTTT